MYVVKQHKPITVILSNLIDEFVACDPEIGYSDLIKLNR